MHGLITFRNYLTLTVVILYLALNYGFMVIRIPPTAGSGIPFGELALALGLVTIHYPTLFGRMKEITNPVPIVLFFALGIFGALKGVALHGLWAMRDATHEIESLYLLLGFAIAGRLEWLSKILNAIPYLLVFVVIYGFLFPFSETLQELSPKIHGAQGQPVPILFQYLNTYIVTLWAVAYLLLFEKNIKVINYLLLAAFLIAYVIFIYQARTIYLQVVALMLLMTWKKPVVMRKMILAVILFLILLFIISVTGIEIKGRLGETVSLDFLISHLKAIVGAGSDSAGVAAASSGVGLRTGWWITIYHNMTSSLSSLLFGLGFGIPLTDFHDTFNSVVREPHNSFISVTARMGLIGISIFAWMHVALLKTWSAAYKRAVQQQWEEGKKLLLFFLSYFVLIWVFSMTEDGLEKPPNAISYYFFWGIILRFALYLKNGEIGPESNPIPEQEVVAAK